MEEEEDFCFRRVRLDVAGIALGVAVLVAACSGAGGPAPGSGTVGPPSPTPAPVVTPSPSEVASASVAPTSSPSLGSGRLPPCQLDQVTIALVDSSVAAGTEGGWLRFTDTGGPCSMQGWPRLVGVTAAGSTTTAREIDAALTFPAIASPPLVRLAQGEAAYAAFEGSDTQPGSSPCGPAYRSLRVTPPQASASVVISAWLPYFNGYLPACTGIRVTFVIPTTSRE